MPDGPRPLRQPEHVYRIRRAIAATLGVLVLFGLWQLVSAATGLRGG